MGQYKSIVSSLAMTVILYSCALTVGWGSTPPANLNSESVGQDLPYTTQSQFLATITVDAGEFTRIDTPVWVSTNDIKFDFTKERFVVVEVNGTEEKEIPAQYEAGDPGKLWFLLFGKIDAGTKRTFRLYARHPRADWIGITTQKDDKALTLKKGYNILSYQYAVMPAPAGQSKLYDRSGFIHPLWSPAGNILMDIHPADHIHHMGIWMPWTDTLYEGKKVDFWNIGDGTGTVRFSKFVSETSGPVFAGFKSEQEHVALKTSQGEKVILNEIWDVRAYNSNTGYIIDFKSTQKNITDLPLIQEQYRYGGFGIRAAKEWKGANSAYLSSEGKTRENGNETRARWCDLSGVIAEKWEGVTVMSNPANFQHPEPMRVWPEPDNYVFFNFAPSQAGQWEMKPGAEHVFQYRLYVHEGKPNTEDIERIWNDYAKPPKVTIEPAQSANQSSNRVILFDGKDFSQWVAERGGAIRWVIEDGTMKIVPRSGGIMTKDSYRDFKMHVEFKLPLMAENVRGQARANSGVYIQRRYEVQILDSYGLEPKNNDCGAIYTLKAPDKNACAKPEEWQTYDITFRAARFEGNKKVENARITVVQNGIVIHDNFEIPNKTGAGQQEGPNPNPILLQEHSNEVWFRNIWIEPQ